jgi:glycosyltransferase involved in cell wall biosynthesis
MSKLSIVIPTHEYPHRLALCLAGIALQAWPGLDVHVVDDRGTCDATPALVADYSRRMNVRYHCVERDGMRLATRRNVGLRFARCSRVLIIDQDCVVAPGVLQGHADYAESLVIVIGIKQCIPETLVAGLGAVDVPRLASLVDPQWEAKYAWVRALSDQVVPTVCECVAGCHGINLDMAIQTRRRTPWHVSTRRAMIWQWLRATVAHCSRPISCSDWRRRGSPVATILPRRFEDRRRSASGSPRSTPSGSGTPSIPILRLRKLPSRRR